MTESVLQKKSTNLKIIMSKAIVNNILTISHKLMKDMTVIRKLYLCLCIHENNAIGQRQGIGEKK